MRTRNKSYADYGLAVNEEKIIMQLIQSHGFKGKATLLACAEKANADIADDLYYSLVCGVSYDNLDKVRTIHLTKDDFYGYRRKTLALFRDAWILRKEQL